MSVARTWVFPIIRIVVFAAIAAALVKLAFFPDPSATRASASDPASPTGQLADPTVQVETGTIRNDVVLKGTVNADAAVAVRATLAGEVKEVDVKQGAQVGPDTTIARIRQDAPNADGTGTVTKWATVKAGATGTLSALPVLLGQQVAVGDALAQIAPPTFNVSAAMEPAQQYRLLNRPADAQVTITGGPAPFTCTGLSITTPLAGADASSGSGGSGAGGSSGSGDAGSSTTVRCAVPGDVQVFAGLAAKVTVSGGEAKDALVLPVTAVLSSGSGGAGGASGTAWKAGADGGKPTGVPVVLGLSDGKHVQVVSGLSAGDEVLQFVPVDDAGGNGDGDAVPAGCAAGTAAECGR